MTALPYLRLVRAGTLFSPAADVIAGICLVEAAWSTAALRLILASVCLYAGGMILNDHADRELDARLRPERPIPRGQITANTALVLGLAVLATGLLCSPIPVYHGIMAILVLGYDYVVKHNALGGALAMGSLRGMNLLVPAIWVNQVPDLRLVLVAAAGYAIYIISITLLGILEDTDHVKRRAVLGLVTVPPLTAALILYAATPQRWPAAAIGLVLAGWMLWRHRVGEWDRDRIRGAMMWLLLGTMLYTGLLAMACGRWPESLAIFAMILPARLIARRIALT